MLSLFITLDNASKDLLMLTPSFLVFVSFSTFDLPMFSEPARSIKFRTDYRILAGFLASLNSKFKRKIT